MYNPSTGKANVGELASVGYTVRRWQVFFNFKNKLKPGLVLHTAIPVLGKLRQEDCEF